MCLGTPFGALNYYENKNAMDFVTVKVRKN